MALDALFLSALARELDEKLRGVRVDKIHQPDRDGFRFALRGGEKLLIDAGNNYPRIHLTKTASENPQVPPMFCMLLRKHLAGGKISAVRQQDMERAVDIEFETTDELGTPTRRVLTVEMMGRHSNLILRDAEDRIIDCLKRVDLAMSEKRQVLPGLFYHNPPAQDKKDPTKLGRAEMFDAILDAPAEAQVDKWFQEEFLGVSPLIWREIIYRGAGESNVRFCELTNAEKERIASSAVELFEAVKSGEITPWMIRDGDKPKDFSFCQIRQYDGVFDGCEAESLSNLLDDFYATRGLQERMRQKSQNMTKTVQNARDRALRKHQAQKQELLQAQDRERDRELADIVTANLYRMERGMNRLVAQDFFKEDAPEIEIQLDIRLTPQQNAAKLYKNYNRKKNAESVLTEEIKKGEAEAEYLETVLDSIARAESEKELEAIREELRDGGYLARQKGGKPMRRKDDIAPREFISEDGFRILVGRNNRQNDLLTLKYANKSDYWFHTQKIPGSHVIVECNGEQPPNRTLTQAAELAAYYSRARESAQVPVDYTKVRNIKKPSGAKPGKVIYVDYQTAYVNPKNM